jgi:SAM-dependent methyltransferase
VNQHLRAQSGDHVLDIGCGPGLFLNILPKDCTYTGFDLSTAYIDAAQKRGDPRATFFASGVDEKLVGALPGQDLAIATGVLHHLPDDLARLLLKIAASNLKPEGRFVSSDGCFTPDQSWLNRLVVAQDRGQFVRPAERYAEMAREFFDDVRLTVYHDLLRIPYSHAIMEATRPRK